MQLMLFDFERIFGVIQLHSSACVRMSPEDLGFFIDDLYLMNHNG